jgi:DnaJ-class molecular chaperone
MSEENQESKTGSRCTIPYLGLEPGVSKEQVKERYRELTKMVHPDKNLGSNTSTDMMKKYNESYHAIIDELEGR